MKILNVLNMKRIVFPFLVMVILGLSSCMKPGDNIQNYQLLPAFVEFDLSLGFTLKTPLGTIVSPDIQKATDLDWGDAVITSFTVNFDQQASTEYTVAYNVEYAKAVRGSAVATSEGVSITGDFDLPIEMMGIYGGLENYLFFGFAHKGTIDADRFVYEMTYDVNEPVLYIRAKKAESGAKNQLCACSMSSFYTAHKNAENTVTFTIQYKTGVDENGIEKFELLKDDYGTSNIYVDLK